MKLNEEEEEEEEERREKRNDKTKSRGRIQKEKKVTHIRR